MKLADVDMSEAMDVGELFLPWNQVDLIFRKSGQPFYWALKFQIGA